MLEYITLDSVSSKFLKGKRLYKNLICEGYKVPLSSTKFIIYRIIAGRGKKTFNFL